MVKLQNLFICILVILGNHIWTSNSEVAVYRQRNEEQALLYQELTSTLQSKYSKIATNRTVPCFLRSADYRVTVPSEESEVSSSLFSHVSLQSQAAENKYINHGKISDQTRIVEVPVILQHKEKFSAATNIFFTFLVTLSLMKLGVSILHVVTYFTEEKHDMHAHPFFPVFDVTVDGLSAGLLYGLYKNNQDRL